MKVHTVKLPTFSHTALSSKEHIYYSIIFWNVRPGNQLWVQIPALTTISHVALDELQNKLVCSSENAEFLT